MQFNFLNYLSSFPQKLRFANVNVKVSEMDFFTGMENKKSHREGINQEHPTHSTQS